MNLTTLLKESDKKNLNYLNQKHRKSSHKSNRYLHKNHKRYLHKKQSMRVTNLAHILFRCTLIGRCCITIGNLIYDIICWLRTCMESLELTGTLKGTSEHLHMNLIFIIFSLKFIWQMMPFRKNILSTPNTNPIIKCPMRNSKDI